MSFQEELRQILLPQYTDGKGVVYSKRLDQALTSIINLVDKELPKKIEPTSDEFLAYNHGFNNAVDQMRAKLKGVSNENINT